MLAISEIRTHRMGRIVYERGIIRNPKSVAWFLQKGMPLGKLREADHLVAAYH